MFSRRTLPVLIALVSLSGMFLLGQDTWGPPAPLILSIDPETPTIDQRLTIYGKDFGVSQQSSFVSFNGEIGGEAAFWSDERIRIDIPPVTTSGPVFVEINGSRSNSVELDIAAPLDLSDQQMAYVLSMHASTRSLHEYLVDRNDPVAMEETVAWVKSQPDVLDARSTETDILIDFAFGTTSSVQLVSTGHYDLGTVTDSSDRSRLALVMKNSSTKADDPSRRAIILLPLVTELPSHISEMAESLVAAGYDYEIWRAEEVTTDLLETVFQFDLVYMETHGPGEDPKRIWLATGERVTKDSKRKLKRNEITASEAKVYWGTPSTDSCGRWKPESVNVLHVSEKFFDKKRFGASLFVAAGCNTAANDILKNALQDTNVKAFAGWTNTAKGYWNNIFPPNFILGALEPDKSLTTAYSETVLPYMETDFPATHFRNDDGDCISRFCFKQCLPLSWLDYPEYRCDPATACYGDPDDTAIQVTSVFVVSSEQDVRLNPPLPNRPPEKINLMTPAAYPQNGTTVCLDSPLTFSWPSSHDPDGDDAKLKYCIVVNPTDRKDYLRGINTCNLASMHRPETFLTLNIPGGFFSQYKSYAWAVWAIDEIGAFSEVSSADWSVFETTKGCVAKEGECDDGLWCNGEETCVGDTCQAGTAPCVDAGDVCNGVLECDEETDSCRLIENVCDDGLAWTLDNCEEPGICTHTCGAAGAGDAACAEAICLGSPICEMTTLDVGGTAFAGQIAGGKYALYRFEVIPDGSCYRITITPSSGNPDLYASRYLADLDQLSDIQNWASTCPPGEDHCDESLNPGTAVDRVIFQSPTGEPNYQSYIAVYGAEAGGYSVAVTSGPCGGPVQSLLPDTGIMTCYNNTVAIECPAPGQPFCGQDAQYTTNPMSYTVNGDGTVTDNVTGLMWQREDDNVARTWANAITYCEGLTLAGHADWRLPDEYELQSIMDYGRYNPAIDTAAFPETNSSYYWSSSTYAGYPDGAWDLYFTSGYVGYDDKTYTGYVRCVR